MAHTLDAYVNELRRNHARRRVLGCVLLALALVVAAGTYWQLRLDGAALANEPQCGLEEHAHTDACYENGELVCGLEEHTHDESCFDAAAATATATEAAGGAATQADACYGDGTVLTCEGDDYTVTVRFDAAAQIPSGAQLEVSEYAKDSETYLARYREMAQLYGWDGGGSEAEGGNDSVGGESAGADGGDAVGAAADSGTDIAADDSQDVRIFNVGFYLDGVEVEPAASVQVTITYATASGATECLVTHFGTDETETVEAESSASGGEQTIEFDIESFSDIAITLSSEGEGAETNGEANASGSEGADDDSGDSPPIATIAETGGEETTSEIDANGSSMGSYLAASSKNDWQVVAEGYQGNTSSYKTNVSTEGYARVQKNVVPTEVENEFLVYLSIDVKQLFADFFESASYQATPSNKRHDSELGTVVNDVGGNENVTVTGTQTSGYNSATFNILSSNGELLASNVKLYWSQANNVTFYIKLTDSQGEAKYVLVGLKVSKNTTNTVMLSEEAEELIMSSVANMVSLTSVTDVMGSCIEYVEVVAGDYDAPPTYDNSTATLTWTPSIKSTVATEKTKTNESATVTYTDHSGNVCTETVYKYETWALNVAELVYKIKLDVTADGFNSCASKMNSATTDKESYAVGNATLTYSYSSSSAGTTTSTLGFQTPYVRGLLYDIVLTKVDENGSALADATFALYESDGTTPVKDDSGEPLTATSNADGTVSFTGLPYGTYVVVETDAPTGYKLLDATYSVALCYTENSTGFETSTADATHMMPTSLTDQSTGGSVKTTLANEKAVIYELPETGGGGTPWYWYTTAGLLVAGSATCLLYRACRTRRERDGNRIA